MSSRILDPNQADEAAFPLFGGTPFIDLVLRETLFIPPRWWHFVEKFVEARARRAFPSASWCGADRAVLQFLPRDRRVL